MVEVSFEAVINPLRRGCGLVKGHLENHVYVGHSLCFTPQWERERWPGGLGGSLSWSRILGGVPGPLISGLLSPDWCESIIIHRGSHREGGGGSCALLRSRGNYLLGASVDAHSSSSQTCSSQETCLWLGGASPSPWLAAAPALLHTSMGTVSGTLGGGPCSPPMM